VWGKKTHLCGKEDKSPAGGRNPKPALGINSGESLGTNGRRLCKEMGSWPENSSGRNEKFHPAIRVNGSGSVLGEKGVADGTGDRWGKSYLKKGIDRQLLSVKSNHD